MKRLFFILLMLISASSFAFQPFLSNTVLTANALNNALEAAGITSGTIDGALIGSVNPSEATFTLLNATSTTDIGTSSTNYLILNGSSTNPTVNTSGGSLALVPTTIIGSGSATNLTVTGAASSGSPVLSATGTTPAGMTVQGNTLIFQNSAAATQVEITSTASATNYLTLTGSNGGNPTISTNSGSVAINTPILVNGSVSKQSDIINSAGRAVNTGTTSDHLAQHMTTTYESANTANAAFTVTIDAPTGDGVVRRICFKNATGTITWTVTSPATATAGLPTTAAAGGCIGMIYSSVAGSPTNAAATTWYVY